MTALAPRVRTTSGPVRGDGTTGASRARRRWRRARWFLGVALVVVVAAAVLSVLRPSQSQLALAPDNPAPGGAQAAARILGRQGVHVTFERDVAAAAREATAGTTLLVTRSTTWRQYRAGDLEALATTPADVVLLDADPEVLETLAPELTNAGSYPAAGDAVLGCSDPDALVAGVPSVLGGGYRLVHPADADHVTLCFSFPGEPDVGSYAVIDGARRVAVLDTAAPLTNKHLDEDGNAALVLRLLGRHDRLVWLVPDLSEGASSAGGGPATLDLLPPAAWAVLAWLLVVAFVAALWRGRRFGRLVPEDLPVVVRAAETTLGRARLYRSGGTRGHAAAGLRARTAQRLAGRLGVPPASEPAALVSAIAAATRRAAPDVHDLLYGPPPPDDAALLALARRLDDLESEVLP